MFSKWLDNMGINDAIWWQHILGILDLRNVFAGFNPQRYMMIWYGFTLLSPVLAFICWYGKGETKVSLIIDILILAAMMSECFAIGFWYFDITRIINVMIFVGSVVILYNKPRQTAISLLGAVVLSYASRMFI